MSVVLYADLNCPFCFALGERVRSWGVEHLIEHRYVEHAPENVAPMQPSSARQAAHFADEVQEIAGLAPEVRLRVPRGPVNTRLAITLVASIRRGDAAWAATVAHEISRAYWVNGEDISDLDCLARLVPDVDVRAACADAAAAADARAWTEEWEASGIDLIPAMRNAGGAWATGVLSEADLRAFLS